MGKYIVSKTVSDINAKPFKIDAVKAVLGDDISDLTIDNEHGIISFIHPKGARIKMSKCEFKDYIIQLLGEIHKTEFIIKYVQGKYYFQYRTADNKIIKGEANNTEDLLRVLQEIVIDICS